MFISVSFGVQCKGYGQCCHLTNGMKADADLIHEIGDLILALTARMRSAIAEGVRTVMEQLS